MLEFKDDPQKLMAALEEFLSVYYADRKIEYRRDINEIESWNIPEPLKYLYSFIEKYLGQRANFCKQDGLYINSGKKTYEGKILIVGENQGCWHCYTDTEGEDPPVWTEDYLKEHHSKLTVTNSSLSQFLTTFCLREILLSSIYCYNLKVKIDNAVAEMKKQGYETVLLWQGKYRQREYDVVPQLDSFYLVEDSILLGDSCWCGTNYKNANRILASIELEYMLNPIHAADCQLTDEEDLKPF